MDEDGLGGVTSNPAIFEKAITGSTDYAEALAELQKRKDLDAMGVYEILAIKDIQDAADILRPVYDATKMRDGYISLEVSPFLARDTEGTLKDARRLWKAVNRPNLLVKVPATAEGIPAIEALISEGINVNVTLLFALEMYEKVAFAYISGLKKYVASGGDPKHVSSVASFFISRIDSMVDSILKAKMKGSTDPKEQALLKSLQGKVAIANAKITYQRYKEIFSGADWDALAKKGAQTQRVLWASTSTKDPSYSDVLYVEELIGPDTVNTMPPQTLDAFRDHGKPKASLEADLDSAQDTMDTLEKVGISMKKVTDDLVTQAVKLFAEPFDKLLNAVDAKCKYVSQVEIDPQTITLPEDIGAKFSEAADDWKMAGKVRRLWGRDATLWTGSDESSWLGWMDITEDQLAHKQHLEAVAQDVKSAGFKHALLLGMGGSSLCPEVLRMTFGKIDGIPRTARARFDGPGAGEGDREQGGSSEHDLYRVEQVGHDARAEHLQAIFLRPRGEDAGRGQGGQPLHRDYGPGVEVRESGAGRRVPAHLPWGGEHRRAVFGAVGFWNGAGGGDGHGRAAVLGSG